MTETNSSIETKQDQDEELCGFLIVLKQGEVESFNAGLHFIADQTLTAYQQHTLPRELLDHALFVLDTIEKAGQPKPLLFPGPRDEHVDSGPLA